MRRIGLLGGMSWESTAEYYRLLNEGVRERLGGHHGADLVLTSLDFAPVVELQKADAWDDAAELLAGRAVDLERAGAQLLVLCTNLMHKVAPAIEKAVAVPFLHIADAVGAAALAQGHRTLGLIGTMPTMTGDFYGARLRERFDVDVIAPDAADAELIHRVIYDELTQNVVEPASRTAYLGVIERLAGRGADAVVLGCTEITLLVGPSDTDVPLLDSTRLHVTAALDAALS
jgi:aspartate racemase